MDGACYLRVQVHRGNYPGFIDNNDSDNDHPKSYHKHIVSMLRKAPKKLEECCAIGNEKTVRNYLNLYSRSVLDKIANFETPLTKSFIAFNQNESGCGGETSIPILHAKHSMGEINKCDRDNEHAKYSTFKQIPYELKVGR